MVLLFGKVPIQRDVTSQNIYCRLVALIGIPICHIPSMRLYTDVSIQSAYSKQTHILFLVYLTSSANYLIINHRKYYISTLCVILLSSAHWCILATTAAKLSDVEHFAGCPPFLRSTHRQHRGGCCVRRRCVHEWYTISAKSMNRARLIWGELFRSVLASSSSSRHFIAALHRSIGMPSGA